jgi:hypothetical protein
MGDTLPSELEKAAQAGIRRPGLYRRPPDHGAGPNSC